MVRYRRASRWTHVDDIERSGCSHSRREARQPSTPCDLETSGLKHQRYCLQDGLFVMTVRNCSAPPPYCDDDVAHIESGRFLFGTLFNRLLHARKSAPLFKRVLLQTSPLGNLYVLHFRSIANITIRSTVVLNIRLFDMTMEDASLLNMRSLCARNSRSRRKRRRIYHQVSILSSSKRTKLPRSHTRWL